MSFLQSSILFFGDVVDGASFGRAKALIIGIWIAVCTMTAAFFAEDTEKVGNLSAVTSLVLLSISAITGFAGIYRVSCLQQNGMATCADHLDALYFSIVTWTTLGYGDFSPPPDIRLVAALEAILGFTAFGLLIGIAIRRT